MVSPLSLRVCSGGPGGRGQKSTRQWHKRGRGAAQVGEAVAVLVTPFWCSGVRRTGMGRGGARQGSGELGGPGQVACGFRHVPADAVPFLSRTVRCGAMQ